MKLSENSRLNNKTDDGDMSVVKVICFGEVLWDMLASGRQIGGAPFNVAHSLSENFDSYLVSAVGDDVNGDELKRLVECEGINSIALATVDDYPTGTVEVELDSKGIPSYTIHENVAWDHIPFSDSSSELFVDCSAVVFGTLAMRNSVSFGSFEKIISDLPNQCIKLCDLNLRQSYYSLELIEKLLSIATHLKLNDEELAIIRPKLSEEEALLEIQETYGLEQIALTKGGEGSLLLSENGKFDNQECSKVQVVDTVGAGDAFTARWLKGLLLDEDLSDLHRACQEAGALACQRKGAVELKFEL